MTRVFLDFAESFKAFICRTVPPFPAYHIAPLRGHVNQVLFAWIGVIGYN